MNQEFEQLRKRFLENYKKACPIMTVLGDEVRQEIFLILIQTGGRGGIRVGDIQKMGHISRSAVSHHLKIMLDAGIISRRREGTKNYYYLSAEETCWEELAGLINLIFASVQEISSRSQQSEGF